uniref:F5/8 type C domain-containing protein n=1 Tax=Macrostomum lignano TaxID=282301 RepID=A0A1I8IXJ5_9PLAT
VGASSLPLELQLRNPCRASWEAFNGSDRWRSLDGSSAPPWPHGPNAAERDQKPILPELRAPHVETEIALASHCGSQTPGCSVRPADGSRREAE